MANIRPIDQASEKWATRAAMATPDYERGVMNPRADWASQTVAAENNYKAAVTEAAAKGRFGAGVKKAGTERWKTGAAIKGTQRYAPGVQVGKGDWQAGFGPYHAAISAVVLPARGPRGAPANFQRVQVIGAALRAVKDRTGK